MSLRPAPVPPAARPRVRYPPPIARRPARPPARPPRGF